MRANGWLDAGQRVRNARWMSVDTRLARGEYVGFRSTDRDLHSPL
jgi:hypothetical protein